MSSYIIVFIVVVLGVITGGNGGTYTIAGLFHDDNYQTEMAFKYAIARYNMFNNDIYFAMKVKRISKTDSFEVQKQVCDLLSADDGIVAVFGPQVQPVSSMVQSICTNLEIPQIQTNFKTRSPLTPQTTLNFYPDADLLATGLATIVRHLDWKVYMIVYETMESLIRLQEILKIAEPSSSPVVIRQLADNGDYRSMLKELKSTTDTNIIVDCRKELIINFLEQANEVEMLEYYHSYFLTALDAHMLNFSVLPASGNITTVRMFDPESPTLHNVVRDWELGEQNYRHVITNLSPYEVEIEAALMYDAVTFFTKTFQELSLTDPIACRPLYCDGNETSTDGYRIANYMKIKSMPDTTLTNSIRFNEFGNRVQFLLEIGELVQKERKLQIDTIATWAPENGPELTYIRSELEQQQQVIDNLGKINVIVSSRIGEPYLRNREPRYEGEILEGNARYEGYSMDLIDAIARELKFNFKFELAADGAYGSFDKDTKKWNGLIKDLLDRKAHLAICDLTITYARRSVVDFSSPFMNLGISILYSKTKQADRNIFAFMEPLDSSVWIYIVSAYISVVLIMYLVARMAPGDWENPHPCDQSPEELENVWDLKNCLWLFLGSTLGQGCDILPKGLSSRMAISMWWFFILVISSSYTANLAAFLTTNQMKATIDGAESLSKQSKIKYGAVEGGSTQGFFRDSNFTLHSRMWTAMVQAKPSVFVGSNDEGVKRVQNDKKQQYAFLMESSSIEFEVEKNCDLKQVGEWLDSKSYGIAMPSNSPYRHAINRAVLKLQEEGTLAVLKHRWWKEKHKEKEKPCDAISEGTNSNELKLANVGGVFLVLGIGISTALLFAFIDFFWNAHCVSVEQKISYLDALKLETSFAVKVWVTQKRTNPMESEGSSNGGEDENAAVLNKKDSLGYNSIDSKRSIGWVNPKQQK